jgi:hypothetical protein
MIGGVGDVLVLGSIFAVSLAAMQDVITLGDMANKGVTMLDVACRRCDRRGRLSIARLIAEHGRDDYGDLRALIAHDCPP